MKFHLFSIIIILFTSCKNDIDFNQTKLIKTKIDSINSKKEIERYIHEIDTNFKNFELKSIQDYDDDLISKSEKLFAKKNNCINNFEKIDIDNNGYTDLIAEGDNHTCMRAFPEEKSCDFSVLAIMNFKKHSEIVKLNNSFSLIAPKIEFYKSKPYLVAYQPKKCEMYL